MRLHAVVISSEAEKSCGPAPAEMTRMLAPERRSNLRCRAGVRFLGFARNDNRVQPRATACNRVQPRATACNRVQPRFSIFCLFPANSVA